MSLKMDEDIKRWTAKRRKVYYKLTKAAGYEEEHGTAHLPAQGPGSALEHALIARFGTLGRVSEPFLLRSDHGLVFTSHSYTALVRSYGLRLK
ncbi:hypothetical protein [Paracandidimonas soli]|uniref:Integrase-like protein n=1 Tax=Paracandidimonas soli TaxID=1917182 RepID=A0A4R3UTG8_9BURK|nr:hypothetical protein [Paracandidimonas soli]TCU95296.1 hypothetical protein EV686_108139 [Paracandidimonas soli]